MNCKHAETIINNTFIYNFDDGTDSDHYEVRIKFINGIFDEVSVFVNEVSVTLTNTERETWKMYAQINELIKEHEFDLQHDN